MKYNKIKVIQVTLYRTFKNGFNKLYASCIVQFSCLYKNEAADCKKSVHIGVISCPNIVSPNSIVVKTPLKISTFSIHNFNGTISHIYPAY